MHAYRAPTLTALHNSLCDKLVTGTPETLDYISSVDVQLHNVIAEATSMEWDFDLKNMWLTKSRWTMMTRQYLDRDDLEAWIGQCTGKIGTKGRGIAVLRTKIVKPRGGAATGHTNKETRRWGSCMLALSYKALPAPQITLHSRTSYLGYIGALDLTVAWMAARYLAKEMGLGVEDFKFVWMNEAVQWHYFKSLAFLLNHTDEDLATHYRRLLMEPADALAIDERRQLKRSPALTGSRRWLQKVIAEDTAGLTYGDMTYNTYRRIRRRFHTEVHGHDYAKQFEGWSHYKSGEREGEQKEFFKSYPPLPHTHVDGLDFGRLGMPINRSYGEPFVGDDGDDDDDE